MEKTDKEEGTSGKEGVMDWVVLPAPPTPLTKCYAGALNPSVTVLGDRTFRRSISVTGVMRVGS